jgi:DNA polymerase-3 subunit delta
MKATRGQIEQALDRPSAQYRLLLLYGPDEAGSRALAKRLSKAVGSDAERVDLAPATLKSDPAALADEAASISLFGSARYIQVEGVGDESLDAVAALMEAPAAGNPVLLIGGALRKESKLLKLLLASPAALCFASYLPEGQEADRMIMALGQELGLRIRGPVAQRLAAIAGGDRAIAARELEKFALYLNASPAQPAELDEEVLALLAAEGSDADLSRLVDTVLSGKLRALDGELARLAAEGLDGIPAIRAVLRRALQLAQLWADAAEGDAPGAIVASGGKAIFWKDKDAIAHQLARWSPDEIARAISRLGAIERAAKASGTAGNILVSEELVSIGRAASRRR